ncbi:putative Opioid growth factor receptor repeat [Leishmania lindenbergi]|uniref:Opioid growth factor receptor repeat n=1 Tax=Leishmania lindenbergi TaxID=651832 RepID=A0AAW2ZZD9_9TRYP
MLKQEFTSDVCDATSLPPTSMRRLVLAAGSLVADFELAHGGLAGTELDEQIARSPFTRTWALYQRVAAPEETLAPRAAPPAALQDSESFASLDVEEQPAVLRRDGTVENRVVFEGDAMVECCHAEGDDDIFFLEADGLSGDVLISSPRVVLRASLSSLSVSVSVAEGSFFRGISRHRVKLEGRYWVKVISSPLLAEAFRLDVANSLDVASEDVQHLELVAGSLVGTFAVVHSCDLLTTAEADEKLRAYHFPLTWAQYPVTPDTAVGHFFEGEALTTIRRSSRPVNSASKRLVAPGDTELLLTASGRRTPQRLPVVSQEASRSVLSSCAQTHSAPMIASVELETLFVASTVHEALPLSEKQTSTSDLPFPVCLEKNNVSEPSMTLRGCTGPAPLAKEVQGSDVPETVSTKHRVGFVGHWWTVILKTHKDDFVAAFVRDTDEKLSYAPDSVDKVQCNEDTGDTIVTFRVTHPSTLLSKNIDLLLRSAPYADVWALYYKYAPSGAQEETCIGVTTYHRVGFVGSKWKDVLGRDMARFKDAFAADTATALNITPQVVRIADYAVADDIVVAFYVTHSVTDSEQVVDAKLELFNYQRVWDLYGNLNEIDELQRVVPCVMKRSPASHHASSSLSGRPWVQHTSSVSATGGFCPNCRGSFSPQQEFLQLGESGGWQAQSVHSHCSSSGDAVHTTLMEDNYLAIRRSPRTPPFPQLARRFTSHASSEMKTSQSSSVHHRGGTSITHGAQMTPRPPWYPSTNSSHIPHPPRQHSFSNTTRHLQRRVNLRELESELSHKQRKRKYQERQEQLDREMRRSLNCSRSSHSTGANTRVPRSFLPHIPVRYTRVRPNLQHTKNGLGHPLE